MKKTISAILIIALTLSLALSLSGCGGKTQETKATIRVGSKDFTENLIVSEIYALALHRLHSPAVRKSPARR